LVGNRDVETGTVLKVNSGLGIEVVLVEAPPEGVVDMPLENWAMDMVGTLGSFDDIVEIGIIGAEDAVGITNGNGTVWFGWMVIVARAGEVPVSTVRLMASEVLVDDSGIGESSEMLISPEGPIVSSQSSMMSCLELGD